MEIRTLFVCVMLVALGVGVSWKITSARMDRIEESISVQGKGETAEHTEIRADLEGASKVEDRHHDMLFNFVLGLRDAMVTCGCQAAWKAKPHETELPK